MDYKYIVSVLSFTVAPASISSLKISKVAAELQAALYSMSETSIKVSPVAIRLLTISREIYFEWHK